MKIKFAFALIAIMALPAVCNESTVPTPPTADQIIEVDGLKWTTGNLVAVVGKTNQCKVGAPTDGGLYFQFGSLLGWKGGTTGDGTGRPTKTNGTLYGGKTFNAANEIHVKPSVFTAIGDIGTTWPNQEGKNLYYFGATKPYSTDGQGLRAFAGFAAGTLSASGVGDPCTYYLGFSWRMPTDLEYAALHDASTVSWTGSWTDRSATSYLQYEVASNTVQLPASGYRDSSDGAIYDVGTYGSYWYESVNTWSGGYFFSFTSDNVWSPYRYDPRCGFPVRCVQ